MHAAAPDTRATPSRPLPHRQEAFATVEPLPRAALLIGACGGFVLAAILTVTLLLGVNTGLWWYALVQAHGHLQLYGWAGLFVLGVAFHFLPRLRGAGLAHPRFVPWLLGTLVAGIVLRATCQSLVTINGAGLWRAGLLASGLLEAAAIGLVLVILVTTATRGPALVSRPAAWSILPFLIGAFASLGVAALANLINTVAAAGSATGLVPGAGDTVNVTLGLFGFLVPMALAMSARALPLYAGLDAFPKRLLWPLAFTYFGGLLLAAGGALSTQDQLSGAGLALMGAVLCVFVGAFLRLMRRRGRIPARVAELAAQPESLASSYRSKVASERGGYGPFVALVASAYMWAVLGGVLLILDGVALALGADLPVPLDAARHSLALGFIALLICGVAPRMLPGFSGGHIRSAALVSATLWLGNGAALLRVGSLLIAPALGALGNVGTALDAAAFGISGQVGLALAICLAVNLWPALRTPTGADEPPGQRLTPAAPAARD